MDSDDNMVLDEGVMEGNLQNLNAYHQQQQHEAWQLQQHLQQQQQQQQQQIDGNQDQHHQPVFVGDQPRPPPQREDQDQYHQHHGNEQQQHQYDHHHHQYSNNEDQEQRMSPEQYEVSNSNHGVLVDDEADDLHRYEEDQASERSNDDDNDAGTPPAAPLQQGAGGGGGGGGGSAGNNEIMNDNENENDDDSRYQQQQNDDDGEDDRHLPKVARMLQPDECVWVWHTEDCTVCFVPLKSAHFQCLQLDANGNVSTSLVDAVPRGLTYTSLSIEDFASPGPLAWSYSHLGRRHERCTITLSSEQLRDDSLEAKIRQALAENFRHILRQQEQGSSLSINLETTMFFDTELKFEGSSYLPGPILPQAQT